MIADPIRLAVVGLGAMGTRMLTAARQHPGYTVVAGVDVAPRTLDVPVLPALDDVLSEVDAVYVSTPPASHAELVLKAFQAGKAVFCEKPLAVDLAEARAMAAAAQGRPNAVNFALSDMAATIEIERRLPELGALRGVEIRLQFPRWPRAFQAEAAWLSRSEQGGFVREVLSHFVYLTDRVLGPLTVESVSADFPEPGAAEVAAAACCAAVACRCTCRRSPGWPGPRSTSGRCGAPNGRCASNSGPRCPLRTAARGSR